LGSGAHTRAVVEDAARNGVPRRFGRRGDPDEVVDEWRYAPTVERIRSAIAGTLGTIASSSVGLYETSRSSGMLSADGCPIGTPRIVTSEMIVAPQPPAWTCSSTTRRRPVLDTLSTMVS